MIDLSKKRIILTGGAGFLGRFVEKKLIESGCSNIFIPRIEEYSLRFTMSQLKFSPISQKAVFEVAK